MISVITDELKVELCSSSFTKKFSVRLACLLHAENHYNKMTLLNSKKSFIGLAIADLKTILSQGFQFC